jgi:hypothetical protein
VRKREREVNHTVTRAQDPRKMSEEVTEIRRRWRAEKQQQPPPLQHIKHSAEKAKEGEGCRQKCRRLLNNHHTRRLPLPKRQLQVWDTLP